MKIVRPRVPPCWLLQSGHRRQCFGSVQFVVQRRISNLLTNGTEPRHACTPTAVGWTVTSPRRALIAGKGYSMFLGHHGGGTGSPTVQDNNGPGSPPASIWAPKYGEANGFTGISPTGGNFFGTRFGHDLCRRRFRRLMTGLTVGGKYISPDLRLGRRAAHSTSGYGLFNGATIRNRQLTVSLGGRDAADRGVMFEPVTRLHRLAASVVDALFTADQFDVNPIAVVPLGRHAVGGLPPMALLDSVSVADGAGAGDLGPDAPRLRRDGLQRPSPPLDQRYRLI